MSDVVKVRNQWQKEFTHALLLGGIQGFMCPYSCKLDVFGTQRFYKLNFLLWSTKGVVRLLLKLGFYLRFPPHTHTPTLHYNNCCY